MDTLKSKKKTIAESDHDLTRKIAALDWDDTSEISVVINHPAKEREEPSSVVQLTWRIFQAVPTAPGKVATVVLLGIAAAVAHVRGWW